MKTPPLTAPSAAPQQNPLLELGASEARFRAVFEQAAVGVAQVAPDGHWLDVNQRLCEIVGYTRAELLPLSFQDITHPDDLATDLDFVAQMLAGEIRTYAMEKRYRRKDGSIVWANLTVSLVRAASGVPEYFISIVEDISARKQAEAEVRASEARYRQLFAANPHPMWVYDLATLQFLAVNEAAIAHYGYSHAEFLRMTIADIRPPADVTRLRANVQMVTEGIDHAGVWQHRRKDGSVIAVEITSHTLEFAGHQAELVLAHDITERLRAEEQLAASERRLRAIFETEPECVKMLAADGSVLEINPAGLRMMEADSLADVAHRCVYPLVVAAHRSAFQELVARAFRGESGRLEFQITGLKGGRRWLETHATPLRDAAGHITALLGITRDITARKDAEEEARNLAQRLALATEAAGVGVFDWDMQKDQWSATPTYFKMLGLAVEEGFASRERWLATFHPEDRERVHAKLQAVLTGGDAPYQYEARMRHADGAYRWISTVGRVLERDAQGKAIRMLGVRMDVTERHQAEQALRESEQRLRLALMAADQGLYDLNLETGEALVSPEYATMLGYDPATFRESNATWLERLHPEDRESVGTTYRDYVAGLRAEYRVEFRQRTRTGEWKWVLSLGRIVERSPAGKPLRMLGTHTDITARKQAEQSLAESRDQLRALLTRLQRAQEEERIRMAREIHDELGQLLTGLKMDVRWLERKLADPSLPPALLPLLDRAVAASELADQTIAVVQKLAAELRPGALDRLGLGAALQQRGRQFQENSGIRCQVAVTESRRALPPELATELYYICQEALTNVARHAQATEVQIRLEIDADVLTLAVSDNGAGMVAGAFTAASSLGLLGMRERAAHCGGTIVWEPGMPQGTRVTVRLPLEFGAARKGVQP